MSYLGVPPFGRTSRTVTEVVATSGQTTFYPTGGYIAGYIDVYLNGAQLSNSDFTASNGSSLVLTIPAVAGDELRFISYTLSLVTGGGGSVTVSATAPPVPTNGSKWVNSNTLVEYTYIEDSGVGQWVELGPSPNQGTPRYLNITTNSGVGISVNVSTGYFSVLTNSGSTSNVSVF